MQLDEVLRLLTRTVECVVNPFRRAVFDVGDDEADLEVEPHRRTTNAGRASWYAYLGLVFDLDLWPCRHQERLTVHLRGRWTAPLLVQ